MFEKAVSFFSDRRLSLLKLFTLEARETFYSSFIVIFQGYLGSKLFAVV
jgi:hypothetical protein